MQINKLLTQINWQKSWLAQRISSLINIKTTDFPDYCSSPKHLISSSQVKSSQSLFKHGKIHQEFKKLKIT